MESDNNNREKHRFARSESVTMTLVSSEGKPLPGHKVVYTQTLDFSSEGIKVRMAEDVPDGSLVSLVIEPLQLDIQYQLTGQVRWCRYLLESVYEAGVMIDDDGSEDYRQWRSYISETPGVKVEDPR